MFLLVLLIGVAGCGGKKTKVKTYKGGDKEVAHNVDIPVAQDGIRSLFDDELGEYALADEKNSSDKAKNSDYSFEDDKNQKFKVVYFDFDHYTIREDQKDVVAYNVDQIKKSLDEAKDKNIKPVVIIEGHACHSAGSATYNLALSEKRAKVLRDFLVVQGIPAESIKIVGRGQEMPAIIGGKAVEGDRVQQAPNRRDEVRVMFS
jgi:outer membrane protein OmpA-like peptidoglycan-associated protein